MVDLLSILVRISPTALAKLIATTCSIFTTKTLWRNLFFFIYTIARTEGNTSLQYDRSIRLVLPSDRSHDSRMPRLVAESRSFQLLKAFADSRWILAVLPIHRFIKKNTIVLCYDIGFNYRHTPSSTKKLPLNIREWDCPDCGAHRDRDQNAAVNILAVRQTVLACGATVRPKVVMAGGGCDEAGSNMKQFCKD